MALTSEEMIEFFSQQAGLAMRGLQHAQDTDNAALARLNCRQGVKCFMMSGLLQWRLGLNPTHAFLKAIDFQKQASKIDKSLSDCAVERIGFLCFLVDKDCQDLELDKATGDLLLDRLLCNGFRDEINGSAWNDGMRVLREHGSRLAFETYETYKRFLDASDEELAGIFDQLVQLFKKRKRDAFYSGSDQTEGGGPDNDHTVDYRLAALAKKRGLQVGSVHCWKWK